MVASGEGVCLWLTGRSGAGKTTVTNELVPMLERRNRVVTVLDVVPELAKHWSERTSEGKLTRKAFVAREVARHGGIAICVTVSARADVRARAKSLVGPDHFVEVFFDIPQHVSAVRKASRTKRTPFIKRLRRFVRRRRRVTGTGSSYQVPESPDLVLDTTTASPADNARMVLDLLVSRGFVKRSDSDSPDDSTVAAAESPPTATNPGDQAG
jgi:sulfate adenylyltransferase